MKRNFLKILSAMTLAAAIVLCMFTFWACDGNGEEANYVPETFEETRIYDFDMSGTNLMGQSTAKLVLDLLMDKNESYFEFGTDGTAKGRLKTKSLDIGGLIDTLGKLFDGISRDMIAAQLSAVDIADTLTTDVEPMFPGFVARFTEGDVEGAMELVHDSIGLNITGLDFSDENLKNAVIAMGEEYKRSGGKHMHLPSNLLDIIPAGTSFSLTADWGYNIVRQKGSDGTTRDAVYIGGPVAHNANTQPFGIFTMFTDEKGVEKLTLRIEFMNVDIALKLRTE